VVVLGNPELYLRFGFRPASEFQISSIYDVDEKYFMLIELNSEIPDSVSGIVHYRKEFGST